jgi:methyl-accepting chemotaxis protein
MADSALAIELDEVRARGVRLLALCSWSSIVLLGATAAIHHDPWIWLAPALAAMVSLPSSIAVRRGRCDPAIRMALALSYAAYPAIAVYVLGGHPWQMDAHLYFLVALAAVSLLYDVRAMRAAAAVMAAHHVLAWAMMPGLAFDGGTDVFRLALHLGAVVAELWFLTMLVRRSERVIVELAAARGASEAIAADAERDRVAAETALDAAARAEQRATGERRRREEAEEDARRRERERLIAIADAFETGVTHLARSLGGAASDLSRSAESLNGLAQETDIRADSVADVAAQASNAARAVADHVAALSGVIGDMDGRSSQQSDHARQARAASAAGQQSVLSLIDRATQVEQFARAIGDLSTSTNLIAINASIEAARVGAVGKGFAVVAGEVKALAQQARGESHKIEELVAMIRIGATEAEDALKEAGIVLDGASIMADDLRDAMRSQRVEAEAARSRSTGLATTADALVEDTDALTGWAEATRRLSTEVRTAANSLSEDVSALLNSTKAFVAQLHAA